MEMAQTSLPLPTLDCHGFAGSPSQKIRVNGSLRMNLDVGLKTQLDPGRQTLKAPPALVDLSSSWAMDDPHSSGGS